MLIPFHLFRPKPLPRYHVPRARLVHLFDACRLSRVILVEAAAGYGKSVAVTEFVQQLSVPVAWFPLERMEPKTTGTFLWNLLRSIQTVVPGFGQQLESLFQESVQLGPYADIEEWLFRVILPAITTEMAHVRPALWIVLEDYHAVERDEVDRAFCYLVENTPENVHLITTSRSVPGWATDPRYGGMGLSTVSADDLTFTAAEVRSFAERMGVVLNKAEADKVYAAISGWPILHHLLYLNCHGKTPEQVPEILGGLVQSRQAIHEYLVEEVLRREPPTAKSFLCRTAILRQLDAATCNALLGIQDAEAVLTSLGKGAFLTPLEGAEPATWIHSHEVVREFLLQVLCREYGDEVKALYHRLGEIFEQRGALDQAIAYYCQALDYAQAERLIVQRAETLVSSVQFDRLARWLSNIPPNYAETVSTLLIYQGIVLSNRKNPLAIEFLKRAQQLCREHSDPAGDSWATVELGWAHWQCRQEPQAVETLRSVAVEASLPVSLRGRLNLYIMIALHNLRDDFPAAVHLGEETAAMLRQDGSRDSLIALVRLLRHLSYIYNFLGRPADEYRSLLEAHSLAGELGLSDWPVAWIDNALAISSQRVGDFDAAHAWLDEADQLLSRYRDMGAESDLFKYISITRGHLYRDTYDYARAEELYRQANRGKPNGVFLALRIAQREQAQEALDLAWMRWRRIQSDFSPVNRASSTAMLGLAYMNVGDNTQAMVFLQDAERVLEHHQAVYYLIPIRLYMARICLQQNPEQGIGYLRYAFAQMRESGYYNLDWWIPPVVAEMCAQAIHLRIEPDFAEQLALRRLIPAYAQSFRPLLNNVDPRVREQASHILECWGEVTTLQARRQLALCDSIKTRRRLQEWLDQGWLTEAGLLQLRQILSWREAEILLSWIYPPFRGSRADIARELEVSVDTVNTYFRSIRAKMEDAGWWSFELAGKGVYLEVHSWAMQQGIVNSLP